MIKPMVPQRYDKCSKQLHMAAHSTAFSWTHLNMLASTTVMALDVLPRDLQYSWPWLHSFRCPNRKISGNEGGHAIGPRLPIQLSGYVAFNHCQTSAPQCTGALSCWNCNLCLTAGGTSSKVPAEQFSQNHVTEQSACQVAWQCSQWFQPKRWHWSRLHTHVHRQHNDHPEPGSYCCAHWTHPRAENMLHSSTDCYVKRAHMQSDDIPICKIASIQDGKQMFVPELLLWHLYWLLSVQSVSDLYSCVPYVLHFLSHRVTASIVKTHWCLDNLDQDNSSTS
jgi:hypothetical protein